MTADETAYVELCVGCKHEKYCHDNVDACDAYLMRVEELEGEE